MSRPRRESARRNLLTWMEEGVTGPSHAQDMQFLVGDPQLADEIFASKQEAFVQGIAYARDGYVERQEGGAPAAALPLLSDYTMADALRDAGAAMARAYRRQVVDAILEFADAHGVTVTSWEAQDGPVLSGPGTVVTWRDDSCHGYSYYEILQIAPDGTIRRWPDDGRPAGC